MTDPFDPMGLFTDNAFADRIMGRMVQPKDEDMLPLDARITNRIRVNNYILRHLSRSTA